jgi:hypothetical protein
LPPELHHVVARYALKQPPGATGIQPCQTSHNPISLGMATFALEVYPATIAMATARSKA